MKVEFDIPDVDDGPIRPGRALQKIFRADGPRDYRDNAVLENLTRLVQHAALDYRLGKEATLKYWTDHSTLQISAILRASTHFETCVTNVHRAIGYLNVIRRQRNVLARSKERLPRKLDVYRPGLQKRIRFFRDAIQHQEERVLNGRIGEGEPFFPVANGDEVPVENNSLKTIDRIELGPERIGFRELANCIRELRVCTEALIAAEYD